jgi:DNA-directed RNA polymerase specialized sigma24 family protein
MTTIVFAAEPDMCPLEDLTRAETIESVRKAVLSLPPKYREVVVSVRATGCQLR